MESNVKIQQITPYSKNTFKSDTKHKYSRQDYMNDIGDGCIALGILTCGDIFTSKQKSSKIEKFGKVMLASGIAITVLKFCDKFFSKDN